MAYGIGASLNSMGLVGQGIAQQREATDMLAKAADEEQRRNLQDEQREQQRKQTNRMAGASAGALAGATYGSSLGPWGTIVGGLAGGLVGGLF